MVDFGSILLSLLFFLLENILIMLTVRFNFWVLFLGFISGFDF